MKHYVKMLLCALALTTGLTACAQTKAETPQSPAETPLPEPTGILKPVASFQTVNHELSELLDYVWAENSLVYREYGYDKLNAERQNSYWRTALDGSGEPELIVQEGNGLEVFCICADRHDALYLFGRERQGEDKSFFLKKQSLSGEELYKSYLEADIPDDSLALYSLYADGEGNLVLANYFLGLVFLFDDAGAYLGKGNISFEPTGLADGGTDGTWLWTTEWMKGVTAVQIDFEQGVVKEAQSLRFPAGMTDETTDTGVLLSGCELGLLVSTKRTLWQYHPDSSEAEALLSWDDVNLNIDGSKISELRVGEAQADGLYAMRLFLGSVLSNQPSETAEITYIDQAYLPERKVITLGTTHRYAVEGSVNRFNRANREYYVEIREYGSLEAPLKNPLEAMVFDPEGIPDILEVGSIQKEILESKGLLEDLDFYLKKSDTLQEKELLDTILKADHTNGKLTALTIRFTINTLGVSSDGVDDSGWSVDTFLSLAEEEQEDFLQYNYPYNMFRCVMEANLNHFVDWEKGECSFDNAEFIELLERMNRVSYAQPGQSVFYNTVEEELDAFLRGSGQVSFEYFSSLDNYQTKCLKYRDKAVIAGYPRLDGTLCHIISPTEQYGIYSASEYKEGAWAFIEFLLSEEEQKRYAYERNGFPVRKAAIAYAMEQPLKYAEGYLTEQNRASFEEILETLIPAEYTSSALYSLIQEELEPFFAGDKTAAETAAVIQNRAQLYLDENTL